ncbi:hypothetical protein RRG08_014550 [Elysia crispata]|uniref:Uncharacterized protein n=1 Tax=Elysia crispata TaxID=231223 RepID=A0AAE1CPD4_9GAST|nr:hypothetical protein RRG08_014550 [Elysia crispata]
MVSFKFDICEQVLYLWTTNTPLLYTDLEQWRFGSDLSKDSGSVSAETAWAQNFSRDSLYSRVLNTSSGLQSYNSQSEFRTPVPVYSLITANQSSGHQFRSTVLKQSIRVLDISSGLQSYNSQSEFRTPVPVYSLITVNQSSGHQFRSTVL